MALSQITSAIVRAALSAGTYAWSLLVIHANINKWSKFKPVRGSWPSGTTGKYGLNLPTNWDYLRPRSGISNGEPYRPGDFRGYEHTPANVMPPAWVNHATSTFAGTSEYNPITYPEISAQLSLNAARTPEITLTNLALNGYYFGIHIRQVAHGTYWYKTLNTPAANNQWITANMNGDFPELFNDGTAITVEFGLSSQDRSSTHSSPSVWIRLPELSYNGISMFSLANMTLGMYLRAIPSGPSVFDDIYTDAPGEQALFIDTSITAESHVGGWKVLSKPSWISTHVWNPTDNRIETAPWYQGLELHVNANVNNTGPYRSGNIVLSDSNNNALCNVPVYQEGGAATATCITNGFSATGKLATVVVGVDKIEIWYTPTDLSSTLVFISVSVLRDVGTENVTEVGYDDSHRSKNGTQSHFIIDLTENVIGGRAYVAVVSYPPGPIILD